MELQVSKTVNAPVAKVWQAITEPEQLKGWFCPENMTVPVAEVDLKVGGAYQVTMSGEDGNHIAVGTYTAIEQPHKLAFTWKWQESPEAETEVTIELKEATPDTTEVTLTHTGFTDEKSQQMHTQGWQSTLNNLEKHLA